MEVIKIQQYKKNFNVVVKDGETNEELKKNRDYHPSVGKWLCENIEKYKDNILIDCNTENCFYTMLFNSLEQKNIYTLIKTTAQQKLVKHSYTLNDTLTPMDKIALRNTEYNKLIKDKSISFCVCEDLQELKYCKRIFKNERIHHLILLSYGEEDREYLDYIISCGYHLYHITPKGAIKGNYSTINDYPVLLKNRGSLLNDVIVVRFD